MADRGKVLLLQDGVEGWNEWRAAHPDVPVDLTDADLRRTQLRGVDLSRAYLSRINLSEANLREANFSGTNLNWADLREADLRNANLRGADLRRTNLGGANFSEAHLTGANLEGVDLSELNLSGAVLVGTNFRDADLRQANLRDADLRGARLRGAKLWETRLNGARLDHANLAETNLNGADLRDANLTGADLRSSRLQWARLDRALMTGVQLWETQRGEWSIRNVECASAFWDQKSEEPVRYAPSEFEKLYSTQAKVELVYLGGITTFEINTLPALLHHLATLHPGSDVRLKSIEETGGGVRVSIAVQEANTATLERIREDARSSQAAQIALRDNQIARLQIERALLLEDVFPRMLAAAGQHVQITGSATNLVIAGGQATVRATQRIENGQAMLELLRAMMERRGELEEGDAEKLSGAVHSVEGELQTTGPSTSMIAAGLRVAKEIAIKVAEGTTEKMVLEHWGSWAHQLTHFLSQVG